MKCLLFLRSNWFMWEIAYFINYDVVFLFQHYYYYNQRSIFKQLCSCSCRNVPGKNTPPTMEKYTTTTLPRKNPSGLFPRNWRKSRKRLRRKRRTRVNRRLLQLHRKLPARWLFKRRLLPQFIPLRQQLIHRMRLQVSHTLFLFLNVLLCSFIFSLHYYLRKCYCFKNKPTEFLQITRVQYFL